MITRPHQFHRDPAQRQRATHSNRDPVVAPALGLHQIDGHSHQRDNQQSRCGPGPAPVEQHQHRRSPNDHSQSAKFQNDFRKLRVIGTIDLQRQRDHLFEIGWVQQVGHGHIDDQQDRGQHILNPQRHTEGPLCNHAVDQQRQWNEDEIMLQCDAQRCPNGDARPLGPWAIEAGQNQPQIGQQEEAEQMFALSKIGKRHHGNRNRRARQKPHPHPIRDGSHAAQHLRGEHQRHRCEGQYIQLIERCGRDIEQPGQPNRRDGQVEGKGRIELQNILIDRGAIQPPTGRDQVPADIMAQRCARKQDHRKGQKDGRKGKIAQHQANTKNFINKKEQIGTITRTARNATTGAKPCRSIGMTRARPRPRPVASTNFGSACAAP